MLITRAAAVDSRMRALPQQIVELGMLAEIGRHEGTGRRNLKPLTTDELKSALGEHGSDPSAGQLLWHLSVRECYEPGRSTILSESNMTIRLELETIALGTVLNACGHENPRVWHRIMVLKYQIRQPSPSTMARPQTLTSARHERPAAI
jgi:hypothetical protein